MHAVLGVIWLLLLTVQPLLIKAAMHAQHRLLGRIGVALGGVFALSGVLLAHRSLVNMGAEQFAREGRFVYLPLIMAVLFAAALAMAVRFRASPALHARFMAATLLPLLDPVLARLLYFYIPPLPAEYLYQVPSFALIVAVLALLARSAPATTTGRVPFAWFSIGASLVLLGFFVIPNTAHGWRLRVGSAPCQSPEHHGKGNVEYCTQLISGGDKPVVGRYGLRQCQS